MRNATSIGLFGASALALTFLGACGGGGDGAGRDDPSTAGTGAGSTTAGSGNSTAGSSSTAGSGNSTAGASSGGSGSGTAGSTTGTAGAGGAPACTPLVSPKKGDGTTKTIDDIDDTNTMFAPGGSMAAGSWDFSKDASKGTITPTGTATLAPVAGGQAGSAFHVQGAELTVWGASLAAFLNGPTSAFDASAYGGVAFYIKGTSNVLEGKDKVMIQARMPDVLPGMGSCCSDGVPDYECYSGHRAVIDISADWQEVKLTWADFKGPSFGLGKSLTFNPDRVRDINFSFNTDKTAKEPASFDVWVDGLRFLSKDEKSTLTGGGTAGAGGTGGTGSAGSAGAGTGGGGTGGTGGGGTGGGGAGGTAGTSGN